MFQNLLAFEVFLYFMMLAFGGGIACWIASAFISEVFKANDLPSKNDEPHTTGNLISLAIVYNFAGVVLIGFLLMSGASESMSDRLSGTAKLVMVINWFVFSAIGAFVKHIQLKVRQKAEQAKVV